MKEILWRLVAFLFTRPIVRDWIIRRAIFTPYKHIASPDGQLYMCRYWLFNEYDKDGGKRWPRLPSIRVHRIFRADQDRACHDHPWIARTIVLQSWYMEQRLVKGHRCNVYRDEGYTGQLLPGEYHRIANVPFGGVWTLFFTWDKVGDWGFLVDDKHVPHDEYLGARV